MKAFECGRGTALPATPNNASAACRFPHCDQEPIASVPVFGLQDMELMMTERRKTARPRKTATRKSARQGAGTTTTRKAGPARRGSSSKRASPKRWSQRVTRESDALDLKQGVFTLRDPRRIAASLKRSAERSSRRKASAYRSALSMLTFYINRAGKTLPKTQRDRLQRAKTELKRQFGKE